MVTATESQAKLSELTAYLDRAVDEVFRTMLDVECAPAGEKRDAGGGTISAVIGLAGALSGSLVLESGEAAARRMAGRMTGMEPEEINPMVRDAIGEIANMVAGAWKGFDSVLSCGCLLSTPTVIAGTSYQLFSQRAPMHLERSYRFEDQPFTVSVFCDLA